MARLLRLFVYNGREMIWEWWWTDGCTAQMLFRKN